MTIRRQPSSDESLFAADLEIDTYRSEDQTINQGAVGVRIMHRPSRTVSCCSKYKSKSKNKAAALKALQTRLGIPDGSLRGDHADLKEAAEDLLTALSPSIVVTRNAKLFRSVGEFGHGDYFLEESDGRRFLLDQDIQKELYEQERLAPGTHVKYTVSLELSAGDDH